VGIFIGLAALRVFQRVIAAISQPRQDGAPAKMWPCPIGLGKDFEVQTKLPARQSAMSFRVSSRRRCCYCHWLDSRKERESEGESAIHKSFEQILQRFGSNMYRSSERMIERYDHKERHKYHGRQDTDH
jgi:hypothetical protein